MQVKNSIQMHKGLLIPVPYGSIGCTCLLFISFSLFTTTVPSWRQTLLKIQTRFSPCIKQKAIKPVWAVSSQVKVNSSRHQFFISAQKADTFSLFFFHQTLSSWKVREPRRKACPYSPSNNHFQCLISPSCLDSQGCHSIPLFHPLVDFLMMVNELLMLFFIF